VFPAADDFEVGGALRARASRLSRKTLRATRAGRRRTLFGSWYKEVLCSRSVVLAGRSPRAVTTTHRAQKICQGGRARAGEKPHPYARKRLRARAPGRVGATAPRGFRASAANCSRRPAVKRRSAPTLIEDVEADAARRGRAIRCAPLRESLRLRPGSRLRGASRGRPVFGLKSGRPFLGVQLWRSFGQNSA